MTPVYRQVLRILQIRIPVPTAVESWPPQPRRDHHASVSEDKAFAVMIGGDTMHLSATLWLPVVASVTDDDYDDATGRCAPRGGGGGDDGHRAESTAAPPPAPPSSSAANEEANEEEEEEEDPIVLPFDSLESVPPRLLRMGPLWGDKTDAATSTGSINKAPAAGIVAPQSAAAVAAPMPMRFPAVMECVPYRRNDKVASTDASRHPFLCSRGGFACLRLDLRGSGDSDGCLEDEYLRTELQDLYRTVEWVSQQPWCNGSVGMFGKSWGAFNAAQVASLRPPGLRAVVCVSGTDDRYAEDVHYTGGCVHGLMSPWGGFMLGFNAQPPDPHCYALARRRRQEEGGAGASAPVEGLQEPTGAEILSEDSSRLLLNEWTAAWSNRVRRVPFFPEAWLEHQTRDEYWRHGSVCEDYDAIDVPMLIVAGWADGYVSSGLRLVAAESDRLRAAATGLAHAGNSDSNSEAAGKKESPLSTQQENATPRRRRSRHRRRYAIIGPWAHSYPEQGHPGPTIGFNEEMIAWWDAWLRDGSDGTEEEEGVAVLDARAAASPYGRTTTSGGDGCSMPAVRAFELRNHFATSASTTTEPPTTGDGAHHASSSYPRVFPDVEPGRWLAWSDWPSECDHVLDFRATMDRRLLLLDSADTHTTTTPPLGERVVSRHRGGGSDRAPGARHVDAPSPSERRGSGNGFSSGGGSQKEDEEYIAVESDLACGLNLGLWGAYGVPGDAPGDQLLDDAHALVFESAPLTRAIHIAGFLRVALRLAASAEESHVCVRISDVSPSPPSNNGQHLNEETTVSPCSSRCPSRGKARLVTWGVLNLLFRNDPTFTKPEACASFLLVDPLSHHDDDDVGGGNSVVARDDDASSRDSAIVDVCVPCRPAVYEFAVGHRIRLSVSPELFPVKWPAPTPVTLRVFPDGCRIGLPLRPHAQVAARPRPPSDGHRRSIVTRRTGMTTPPPSSSSFFVAEESTAAAVLHTTRSGITHDEQTATSHSLREDAVDYAARRVRQTAIDDDGIHRFDLSTGVTTAEVFRQTWAASLPTDKDGGDLGGGFAPVTTTAMAHRFAFKRSTLPSFAFRPLGAVLGSTTPRTLPSSSVLPSSPPSPLNSLILTTTRMTATVTHFVLESRIGIWSCGWRGSSDSDAMTEEDASIGTPSPSQRPPPLADTTTDWPLAATVGWIPTPSIGMAGERPATISSLSEHTQWMLDCCEVGQCTPLPYPRSKELEDEDLWSPVYEPLFRRHVVKRIPRLLYAPAISAQ